MPFGWFDFVVVPFMLGNLASRGEKKVIFEGEKEARFQSKSSKLTPNFFSSFYEKNDGFKLGKLMENVATSS